MLTLAGSEAPGISVIGREGRRVARKLSRCAVGAGLYADAS